MSPSCPVSTPQPKECGARTIISWCFWLKTLRFTTWRYFKPDSTWCWTLKVTFMRKVAPSLIVNGVFARASTAAWSFRSMMISGRPSTSRPSDRMMHLRGSFGSDRSLPVPRPRDSFHLRRDSSFWSASAVSGAQGVGSMGDTNLAACTRQLSSSGRP
jgi:hypothetical protein